MIRTRFAPSPTGYLHIGSVRTALFAYLLAKHAGGQFVLRIEDTDRERLVPDSVLEIQKDLEWLGIFADEGPSPEEMTAAGYPTDGWRKTGGHHGPYIQSLRQARYREVAHQLLASGRAYVCDCSPEQLQQEREEQAARKVPPGYGGRCRERNVPVDTPNSVIRLRLPDGPISYVDGIRGAIRWDSMSLKDPVLLKSDGFPTYHLAVVIDDHDMDISHVIRAEEWIPSTPIQIVLHDALGWPMPTYCHVAAVLGDSGKKLSKREGAIRIADFREKGYLPEALLNFLALLGWSPGEGDTQELFSMSELIERYSLEHTSNAGAIFSYEKLNWFNGMYIRNLAVSELAERLRPRLIQAGLSVLEERFQAIVPHIQERLVTLDEAPSLLEYLFVDKLQPDFPAMFQKGIDAVKAAKILDAAFQGLSKLDHFETATIEASLQAVIQELGVPKGPAFGVVRIAVTGKKVTPPLFESIAILGRDDTLARISDSIISLKSMHSGDAE